jgi:uncharacterized membrane protein
VLVFGGAGYIGSVVSARLLAVGHDVAVADNLSPGHADAVPHGVELVEVDLADERGLADTFTGPARAFRRHTPGNPSRMATLGTHGTGRRDASLSEAAITRPRAPGIVLGVGLGGFVDGIVLHQILQWHHLLSSEREYPKTTVVGLEDNTLADGLFHAGTFVAVVVGLWFLWRRTNGWRSAASGQALLGWMLVGWGGFNLVEGAVNHHVLGLHHVREGAGHQTAYDLGFLTVSAVLVAGGWLIARSGAPGWSRA